MPRYRTGGGLDDATAEDGDVGFLGMNLRLPVWQLPAGMLSLSENGRIDGEWMPRKGVDVVTEGTLATGNPLRLPFWLVDETGGKTVSAASRNGETVTLTVDHGLTVGGSAASITVTPAGSNNSLLFTAVATGVEGSEISIRYVASGTPTTSVTVDGNAITVYYAATTQVRVSGSLTSNGVTSRTFSVMPFISYDVAVMPTPYFGTFSGASTSTARYVDDADGLGNAGWLLYSSVLGVVAQWYSLEAELSPELCVTWTAISPATGTPVVELIANANADDIFSAINSDSIASAMVTPSSVGPGYGAVADVGPVFLQGGASGPAYLNLEGVTGTPTVDPNGAWLMTPVDADTLTFEIDGAAVGTETYTVTTAKVLSELDDFATGEVLGSCLFSDPSSSDAESVFLAFGNEVQKVSLATGAVTSLTLPGSTTIDGRVEMIQAMDKVLMFRAGLVALEWIRGAGGFTAVASGDYTQPQILTANGADISLADGLVEFTVVGNSTMAVGDWIFIHAATDARFLAVVGNKYRVESISGSTIVRCYMALPDSAGGSGAVQIGKQVSIGGGFIHQPGFPWAIYFQRRIWGPFEYRWDTSLTPDAFTARNVHDEIVAGDILDTDTFDPIDNQFRITSGVADHLVALHPFFDDTLLVLMRNSIHAISGTVGSLLDCTVTELTREIGCLARKSVVTQGNSIFFLSDNGVYGLAFADQYNLRGMERPLSEAIQPYIDRISMGLASNAVAAYHNNRYWLAVPLDSSPRAGDASGNNAILVFNLLNREWESIDTFGDPNFLITDFIIGTASGRNDLHAITSAGGIHILDKLDEDYDRIAINPESGTTQLAMPASMQTRGYACATTERKRFAELGVQMKSGSAQSDIGINFATDDPDNTGSETLASATLDGPLEAENTADVRQRVGGLRGFNGIVSIRRQIGRPQIRGVKVAGTIAARATLTQK